MEGFRNRIFDFVDKEVFISLPAAGCFFAKVKLVAVKGDYITVERYGKKTFIRIDQIMSIGEG